MRLTRGSTASYYSPVDRQQYDGSYCGYKDGPEVEPRHPGSDEDAEDEATNEGASDPYEDRYYYAAGIVTWHDELAQRARDQADDDQAYDGAYAHFVSSFMVDS
jgi:hypothetical protein